MLPTVRHYYTGLDLTSFEVVADFPLDGASTGQNLAPKFRAKSEGVWEWVLEKSITQLPVPEIIVSVKDRQGNVTRIERVFSVGQLASKR